MHVQWYQANLHSSPMLLKTGLICFKDQIEINLKIFETRAKFFKKIQIWSHKNEPSK